MTFAEKFDSSTYSLKAEQLLDKGIIDLAEKVSIPDKIYSFSKGQDNRKFRHIW